MRKLSKYGSYKKGFPVSEAACELRFAKILSKILCRFRYLVLVEDETTNILLNVLY